MDTGNTPVHILDVEVAGLVDVKEGGAQLISEQEENDRDRVAADKIYREALEFAKLEFDSLQAAVDRSYKLKTVVRTLSNLLGIEVEDKYKYLNEIKMQTGTSRDSKGRARINDGISTDTRSSPKDQGHQSSGR